MLECLFVEILHNLYTCVVNPSNTDCCFTHIAIELQYVSDNYYTLSSVIRREFGCLFSSRMIS